VDWLEDLESLPGVVAAIVRRNQAIADFWSSARGWAPSDAADLLSKSRLDRQVSLSRTLTMWISLTVGEACPDREGCLILAWANLGALVEGTMKWFLCVHYRDYRLDENAIRDRKAALEAVVDPDGLTLEPLRAFFDKVIWTSGFNYGPFVSLIQQRRNLIHAFKDKALGTVDELHSAIRTYAKLLEALDSDGPYPDGSGPE
jgi:hypothetical protein